MKFKSIFNQQRQSEYSKEWRERLKEAGYIRKTVIVHQDDWDKVYNYTLKLRQDRGIETMKERGEL